MSKKKKKFASRYVYGPPVCKECGTKVFIQITKTRFKCVLCKFVSTERKQ